MRQKLLKVLVFYVIMQALFVFLHWLAERPLFNIISLENLMVSDASLNDMHYQLESKQETEPALSGKIIMVNTGSLSKDSFRLELASTLTTIQSFQPKVVSIDHVFSADSTLPGTDKLKHVLNNPELFLLAKKSKEAQESPLDLGAQWYGNVQFPEDQSTIRRYSSDTGTFAYQTAFQLMDGNVTKPQGRSFFINYLTNPQGYFNTRSDEFLFYQAAPELKQGAFLTIEAKDILQNDSVSIETLKKLSPGRAILVGHLGNTQLFKPSDDIEDRHRVPCDTSMIDRERTMSGIMIHANAIENIIEPKNRFYALSDTFLYFIFKQMLILLFLYYLLFFNLGKSINILCLALLTFPIIYFILYLMKHNVYVEIGLTLLQFLILEEIVEVFESIHHTYLKIRAK